MTLDRFLESRYPSSSPECLAVRDDVRAICSRFSQAGLAGIDFEQNLSSGDEARFWQRFSEAILGVELLDRGCDVRPSKRGPDLLVVSGNRNVWIEVICPEPTGVPDTWLNPPNGTAYSFPHETILLRWTAAIKEKAEKLLGNTRQPGYLAKGIVGPNDAYVIAVNGRRLRNFIPQLEGISQLPAAAEAVFAIGPIQVHIDHETLKVVGHDHQHRPQVRKPSTDADVPAYTFLDPRFAAVSAIWAVDRDDCRVVGNLRPMQVVHNPNAINPLPQGLLPADYEWSAIPHDTTSYSLRRWPPSTTRTIRR